MGGRASRNRKVAGVTCKNGRLLRQVAEAATSREFDLTPALLLLRSRRMSDDLQFEKAEFAAPSGMQCAACAQPLVREYYAANGQTLCADCVANAEQFVAGKGLGVGRFARAVLFGVGAAVAGAAGYGGIMMATNMEIGLISIAVGWLVGKAVRAGSLGRGGWRYQLLAAVLTYTSICCAYAAFIYWLAEDKSPEVVAGLAVMLLTLPFLGGATNILGWLIIGFGVWQAWQMNRPLNFEVTGPHSIGGAGPQLPR